MAKDKLPPLGSGERFRRLKARLTGKVGDPGAVAASLGRETYGEERFQQMAAAGRRRKARARARRKGG